MAPALSLGQGIPPAAKVSPAGSPEGGNKSLPIPARNGSASSALPNFSGTYRECAGWADGAEIGEGEPREKSFSTSSAHLTGFSMI